MIKQNEHRKTYSKEFKLQAVKMKVDQGCSYAAIVQETGIARSMIKRWVKSYQAIGEAGLEERRGHMSAGRPRVRPITKEDELAKRIRRLEMENEVLKKLLELQGRELPRK